MNIVYNIYKKILQSALPVPPETGGILGGSNGIVTNLVFDKNVSIEDRAIYIPNVDYLNSVIEKWSSDNIEFYGIFHTHLKNSITLSGADKENIKKIMLAMPSTVNRLYFPIVIPQTEIYSYEAEKRDGKIYIIPDKLNIVGKEAENSGEENIDSGV